MNAVELQNKFVDPRLLYKAQFDVCLLVCMFDYVQRGINVLSNDARWENVLFYMYFYH